MLPNKSTPPKAETDLPLGRARIPANWSLQLVPILATRIRVQHATSLRYDTGQSRDQLPIAVRSQPAGSAAALTNTRFGCCLCLSRSAGGHTACV
eukprot:scaffold60893_cov77-Phaeocystis_antarctica.AAC.1